MNIKDDIYLYIVIDIQFFYKILDFTYIKSKYTFETH